jgi:threonine/homoserine/homoserine lactone efflux protein
MGSLPLLLYGFALGWSVAWPPGPVNAEMVRRGLARGFRPACAVGLGAASGDALWAAAVMLGAGVMVAGSGVRRAVSVVSAALLLLLAALFLLGALRDLAAWRRGRCTDVPAGSESGRTGYILGFSFALSSPWNIAFWLAVLGAPDTTRAGLPGALLVTGAVLVGTITWVLLLCGAVAVLRLRVGGPLWDVTAKGATGLLMLFFALRAAMRLAAG